VTGIAGHVSLSSPAAQEAFICAAESGETMDRAAYALMAAHEDRHWWFVGRRAVIAALIDRTSLPDRPLILEAGCGSGGNLGLLEGRGIVSAFEPFEDAASNAQARYPGTEVRRGELPNDVPFGEGTFDLVAALDVLEHVQDDVNSLAALVRLAKPGAAIIVTVPAHQLLWGSHDRRLHHVRRYGKRQMREIAAAAGADIVFETAFNSVLAPAAILYRLAERVSGRDLGNQELLPAHPLNRLLAGVFALERHLVARISIPFGLSYGYVMRRRTVDQSQGPRAA
jgi:SAM-dependent methyltransferase